MRKRTFLPIVLITALVGCFSNEGNLDTEGIDSDIAMSGDNLETDLPEKIYSEITVFDGYLKNAVVYHDTNENGALDIGSDIIYGLTDKNGNITIEKPKTGYINAQTLVIGGDMQTALALLASETYADVYTVDQDSPNISVTNEVSFRAPVSSNVISPITDIIVAEIFNSNVELATAVETVQLQLGVDGDFNLFEDFIAQSDINFEHAKLHKIAQIISQSKIDFFESYQAYPLNVLDKSLTYLDGLDFIESLATLAVIGFDGSNSLLVIDQSFSDSNIEEKHEFSLNLSDVNSYGGYDEHFDVKGLFTDADLIAGTFPDVMLTELSKAAFSNCTGDTTPNIIGGIRIYCLKDEIGVGEYLIEFYAEDTDVNGEVIEGGELKKSFTLELL